MKTKEEILKLLKERFAECDVYDEIYLDLYIKIAELEIQCDIRDQIKRIADNLEPAEERCMDKYMERWMKDFEEWLKEKGLWKP